MAKRIESFKVDEEKKVIIIYTNVEANAAEKELKEWYLANGYKPMTDTKKQGISVAEMRKELKKDADALAKFNDLYKSKEKVRRFPSHYLLQTFYLYHSPLLRFK